MRLCPSAGSCFFDAGGLDVFAIDGESFWMVRTNIAEKKM